MQPPISESCFRPSDFPIAGFPFKSKHLDINVIQENESTVERMTPFR
jgi:hypothetical protein